MIPDRLLTLYGRVADIPDALPQFRIFVLDLAVRGRLVEQNPSDEPASELLKRIVAEKDRLIQSGELRKRKALPRVESNPFPMPEGWVWTRLREITSDRGQTKPNTTFTYIDVSSIDNSCGAISKTQVLQPASAPSRARKIVNRGDVVYSCVRPYLRNIAVIDSDLDPPPIASTAYAVLNGHGLVNPYFLWTLLRSSFMSDQVERFQRGQAYPAINDSDFSMLLAPLPPLAEQHRIVAKVEELMAICDKLEESQARREETRDSLTNASFARLCDSDTNHETFQAHARFAINVLPKVTVRPDQVDILRQTILDLAVRGRLVQQNPKDEPASELLKRIAVEKVRLSKLGQIRKPRAVSPLNFEDVPYSLPNGWQWTQIAQLGIVNPRNKAPDNVETSFVPMPLIDAKFGARHGHHVRPWGEIKQGYTHFADGDVGMAKITPCFENGKSTVFCNLSGGIGSGTTELHVVRPILVNSVYVLIYLKCSHFIASGIKRMTGTAGQKRVPAEYFASYPVPLPPLVEQRRIVDKVNELIRVVDKLAASVRGTQKQESLLLNSLIDEAIASSEEV